MSFGIMNYLSTIQRTMDKILDDVSFVRMYLVYVVILSRNMKEHLQKLECFIEQVILHGLKLKKSKLNFAQPRVELLGYIVEAIGVFPYPKKLEEIQKVPLKVQPNHFEASLMWRVIIGDELRGLKTYRPPFVP